MADGRSRRAARSCATAPAAPTDATPRRSRPISRSSIRSSPSRPSTDPPVMAPPTTEAPAPPPSTIDPTTPTARDRGHAGPGPAPVATDPGRRPLHPSRYARRAQGRRSSPTRSRSRPCSRPPALRGLPPVAPSQRRRVGAGRADLVKSPPPRPRPLHGGAGRAERVHRRRGPAPGLFTLDPNHARPSRERGDSDGRAGQGAGPSRAGSPTRSLFAETAVAAVGGVRVGLQPAGGAGRLRAAGCRRSAGHLDHHVHPGRV